MNLHHIFFDFIHTYESIGRDELWMCMKESGIPDKLVRLAKMSIVDSKGQVSKVQGQQF